MGRTNPTFRDLLRGVRSRFGSYRRALRRADQPHLDRLFDQADAHADAASYLNADDPVVPILVSMLLEHEKRLARLEAEAEAGTAEGGDEPPTDDPDSRPGERDAV